MWVQLPRQKMGAGPGPGFESRPHTLMGQVGSQQRVDVRSVRPLSNKRLKLAAPGLGKIPFVPQRTSCSLADFLAPAGWGAAA